MTRLGCRVEYLFRPERATNNSEAAAGRDQGWTQIHPPVPVEPRHLDDAFPQHVLDVPSHDSEDVDLHTELFAQAADELTA